MIGQALRHIAIRAAALIGVAGCAKTSPVADTAADEAAIRSGATVDTGKSVTV